MQHKQLNYKRAATGALLVVAFFFAAKTAFSQGIADRNKPDPTLTDQADGPCDPALGQPDLTPGTDVAGHQVASADIQTGPIPVQGEVLVPLKSGQNRRGSAPAYVAVDGKKLDPLLNPKPACH